MNDMWKSVEGYEGLLEVSDLGRVRCLDAVRGGQKRRGTIYRPFIGKNGYDYIAPKIGPTRKKMLVHRLVAAAFVPGWFESATVNHLDGNKRNNRAENLEWITRADNTRHQWRTGLVDLRGEKHPSSKLSDKDLAQVRARISAGDRIVEIARTFNVSTTLVYKIRSGEKRAYSLPVRAPRR